MFVQQGYAQFKNKEEPKNLLIIIHFFHAKIQKRKIKLKTEINEWAGWIRIRN